jgi:tetratricopeptide (TPR) repeat protein
MCDFGFCGIFARFTAGFLAVTLVLGCQQREAYQLLDRANGYEAAGYEDLAIETYVLAAAADSSDAYLHRALARAYMRRSDYDRASDALREAIAFEPAYLDAYQDLIRISVAQDDVNAALGWLEKAARAVPGYTLIYEELVTLYLASERLDEAFALLEDLAVRFPKEAWVHFRRGGLLRLLERSDEALEAFSQAAYLDDELPDLWAEVGNLQYDLEAFDEAEDAYSRAIDQDPNDHRSMNNLAWVYAEMGKEIDRGIELSRSSLELREEPSYMDTLAELYYKQGDRRRALIWIRRALRMGSDSPELNDHLKQQFERFQRALYGRT